jgi:pimeloyl-ACP methyl ester carboxylesterase
MLHHCLPGVAEEYDKNVEEVLYRSYSFLPGVEVESGTPEVTNPLMFPAAKDGDSDGELEMSFGAKSAPGLWKRLPRAKKLPSWLTPNDFEYYVSEFSRSGFAGGLRWYQALDLNWSLTKDLADRKVKQPALFIAGEADPVLDMYGGLDAIRESLAANCEALDGIVVCKGAAPCVQQERSEEVNTALFRFLRDHAENMDTATPKSDSSPQ